MSNDANRLDPRERFLLIWAANPAEGSQTVIGPATSFWAVGPSLRAGPRGQEAAQLRDGFWVRRKIGGRFSLLWTEALTTVQFQDPSAGTTMVIGPFDMVGFVSSTIYVDRENSRPAAVYDEPTGRWRASVDGTLWPEVLLAPVSQAMCRIEERGGLVMHDAAACA